MDVISVLVSCIVVSFLCVVLRDFKGEYALLAQIGGIVILFLFVITQRTEIVDVIESFTQNSTIDFSSVKILLKALAISIITDFASTFCKDSGNETLSKGVDFVGKTAVIALSLPLLTRIIELALSLLE